jgi:hypothetical protein
MTDEQIKALWLRVTGFDADGDAADIIGFARALLADGGKGEAVYQYKSLLGWDDCTEEEYKSFTGFRKRILYTAPQAECAPREAQPDGWKLMPMIPTVEMTVAARAVTDSPCTVYALFLDAAPTPERADAAPNPSDKQEAVKAAIPEGDYDLDWIKACAPTPERAPCGSGMIDAMEDFAPVPAPREAQPVDQWLRDLRRAHEYLDKGEPFFTGKDCAELADLIESLAAPTPERAQPVGPRTTLNFDGTVDITCAHCGGNGCFACLKSAAPTPERADAVLEKLQELTMAAVEMRDTVEAFCGERADAGKDAALTDEQIIEIFQDHYTEEPGDAEPGHILPFARAILAADKGAT